MQHVLEYAQRAKFLFEESKTATVHSSYKSTINIVCDGQLFSLQPAGLPRTPICINLDTRPDIFSSYKPAPGAIVQFTPTNVYGFNTSFQCEGAKGWNPSIREKFLNNTVSSEKLRDMLARLIWSQKGRGGFEDIGLQVVEGSYRKAGMSAEYARTILERMLEAGRLENWREAAQSASELIGAGQGLTPSGDDLNIGLLAVLYFLGGDARAAALKESLTPLVRQSAQGTTAVSREFLLRACEGEFTDSVIETLEAAQTGGDLLWPLKRVCDAGHSSGLDFLNGMFIGFTLMGALHKT